MNKDAVAGCPSGCAREKYPREASIFDPSTPQIILAWDGDKIDMIPLPAPQGEVTPGTPIQLTSDEVIHLVREFLSSRQFALPGLSLRIHSRNPVAEYVLLLSTLRATGDDVSRNLSELLVSPNRHSSPFATPLRILSKPITDSGSSQTRIPSRHRSLSKDSMLISIHRSPQSSLAAALAFGISFAPTTELGSIHRFFYTPLNVRPNPGKLLPRVSRSRGKRHSCSTRHGSRVSSKRLAAWQHCFPACTV
jgi:hypothetical protein